VTTKNVLLGTFNFFHYKMFKKYFSACRGAFGKHLCNSEKSPTRVGGCNCRYMKILLLQVQLWVFCILIFLKKFSRFGVRGSKARKQRNGDLESFRLSLLLNDEVFMLLIIYAEVEIPVASNLRLVVDKTFLASNLESITVSSDVDVFYFTLGLK